MELVKSRIGRSLGLACKIGCHPAEADGRRSLLLGKFACHSFCPAVFGVEVRLVCCVEDGREFVRG